MLSRRVLLAAGGVALFGAGLWLASGPPRLTMLNAALRLDHPPLRAWGALLSATGCAVVATALRQRVGRIGLGLVALLALLMAARLAVYRIELTDSALVSEGLLRREEIPWNRIARVDISTGALLVFEGEELVLRIGTSGFSPEQQATVERGIARRVREASRAPQ